MQRKCWIAVLAGMFLAWFSQCAARGAEQLDKYRGVLRIVGHAGEKTLQGAFDVYPESETSFFLKINGAQLTLIKKDKTETTPVVLHMDNGRTARGRK